MKKIGAFEVLVFAAILIVCLLAVFLLNVSKPLNSSQSICLLLVGISISVICYLAISSMSEALSIIISKIWNSNPKNTVKANNRFIFSALDVHKMKFSQESKEKFETIYVPEKYRDCGIYEVIYDISNSMESAKTVPLLSYCLLSWKNEKGEHTPLLLESITCKDAKKYLGDAVATINDSAFSKHNKKVGQNAFSEGEMTMMIERIKGYI